MMFCFTCGRTTAQRSARGTRTRTRMRDSQTGAAALVVVLMLFFVISLVAAYTSRNLIFEQRTAVNQYRSTMAFETAEAGIEWALSMLNGGRVGDDCTTATATATSTTFRQRYLTINTTTGMVVPRVGISPVDGTELWPTCVWNGTNWICRCPGSSDLSLLAPTGAGLFPAFRIRFSNFYGPVAIGKPGAIRIEVNGCVKMENSCLRDFTDLPVDSEGRAQHTALLALKTALTTQPAAAITVWGGLTGGGALSARNTNSASGGLTVHAAGPILDTSAFTLVGAPGTPGSRTVVADDTQLVPDGLTLPDLMTAPVDNNRERVFASVFGLLPASHRTQPAAVLLNCPVSGCRQLLADTVAANPGRVVWVTGDLTLESAGIVGSMPSTTVPEDFSVAGPASIVVNGNVIVTDPGARIFVVVYVRGMLAPLVADAWQGAGEVIGALLTESGLSATAAPGVTYDKSVLDTVRRRSGSFVRVPGDSRDFKVTGS